MFRRSRKGSWERAGQFGAFAVLHGVSREGFTEQRTFELKGPERGACLMQRESSGQMSEWGEGEGRRGLCVRALVFTPSGLH